MKLLNQGVLTVVGATILVSGVIIYSGDSLAENKLEATGDSTITKKNIVIGDSSTNITTKHGDTNNKEPYMQKRSMLSPPPGPFLDRTTFINSQGSVDVPVAPKAPSQPTAKVMMPTNPVSAPRFKVAPVKPEQNIEVRSVLKSPSSPLKPSSSPKMKQVAPQLPRQKSSQSTMGEVPTLTSQKPVITPPNVPIWSQSGKVTNQDIKKQGVSRSNKTTISNGNIGWGYPRQQYMYIPVPIMPNVSAPQIPAFNNSWGVPMPNYWTPVPIDSNPLMNNNNATPKK